MNEAAQAQITTAKKNLFFSTKISDIHLCWRTQENLTETINWNEQIQKLVLKSVSWLVDEVYYPSFLLEWKMSDLYPLILIKSEKNYYLKCPYDTLLALKMLADSINFHKSEETFNPYPFNKTHFTGFLGKFLKYLIFFFPKKPHSIQNS